MRETTHLVCARCGCDSSVSNFKPSDGTLTMQFGTLMFNCLFCKQSYALPITEVTQHNETRPTSIEDETTG